MFVEKLYQNIQNCCEFELLIFELKGYVKYVTKKDFMEEISSLAFNLIWLVSNIDLSLEKKSFEHITVGHSNG